MLICSLLVPSSLPVVAAENWPAFAITDAQVKTVEDTFDGPTGYFHDTSHLDRLVQYDPAGDYLRASLSTWTAGGDTSFDSAGLPMITYNGQTYYNPVVLSQFALSKHGRFVNGDTAARAPFLAAADKLIAVQSPDGGFSYPIELHHKEPPLLPGWRSAMAQGQALSALTRAYRVTSDVKYFNAASLAYHNMQVAVEAGGTRASLADLDPSLAGYLFFPEYPYERLVYTLNGYMFTLLGLYDWAQQRSDTQADAQADLQSAIRTLEKIMPYYDVAGYSAYNLEHVQTGAAPYLPFGYECIHVYLLHALNSLVSSPTLKYFEDKWTRKLAQVNKGLRITITNFNGKPSPQRVGTQITLGLATGGGTGAAVSYQFAVKFNGNWTIPQPYSTNNTFVWTPLAAGDYVLGLYVKNAGSTAEYDNYRSVPYTVTP